MTDSHSSEYAMALKYAHITHQISWLRRAFLHMNFAITVESFPRLLRDTLLFTFADHQVLMELTIMHVSICRTIALLEKELDFIANCLDNPALCKVALAMIEEGD